MTPNLPPGVPLGWDHDPRYAARPSTLCLCRLANSPREDNLCLAVKDVSESGACLLLRRPLPAGCEAEVLLLSASRLGGLCRRATVVWDAPEAVPGNGFLTGLRFHEPLPAKELVGYVALLPGEAERPPHE